MRKKLLSLALALVLALSLLPTAALADWENAKEVKNYDEFIAAAKDEKVEEIKITGEVTVPKTDEPILVETPVLVAKDGKLSMAPEAVMSVHVPEGKFNFEDAEKTWDLVAGMCETFIIWHSEEDTYNRDVFGTQPDINQQVKDADGESIDCLVASGDNLTLTENLSVESRLQVTGHDLTIGKGVALAAGVVIVDGNLIMEEGASLVLNADGAYVTGDVICADESQVPEGLGVEGEIKTASSEASAPETPAAAPKFTDVAATSPFAPAIDWAVAEGITNGTTATTFGPGNTCSISNIITFLWRANGKPGAAEGVADRDSAAAWAKEKRMIADEDVSAPCTRLMAVAFMWIAAGEPEAEAEVSFTDLVEGADYMPSIAWAVENGVTTGTSETTFSPDNTCTRGQIVTFLYRAANS